MANHCIYEYCIYCGTRYCIRGCGHDCKCGKEVSQEYALEHDVDLPKEDWKIYPVKNYCLMESKNDRK